MSQGGQKTHCFLVLEKHVVCRKCREAGNVLCQLLLLGEHRHFCVPLVHEK